MAFKKTEDRKGAEHIYDIVVVGAGLAGLTVARHLPSSADVLVLERGELDGKTIDPACAEGECIGLSYPFSEIRDFGFGGSTSIWAGYTAPFDPLDFEKRDWVPLSGWPINKSDLNHYQEKAAALLNLGNANFDSRDLLSETKLPEQMMSAGLGITTWQFGNPILRAGHHWLKFFIPEDAPTVLTQTRVIEIVLTKDHESVNYLSCLDAAREPFKVRAKQFVIALGGLETPRLLLASHNQNPAGVGNSSGFVGACFCEHPHMDMDNFLLNAKHDLSRLSMPFSESNGRKVAFNIGLAEDFQVSEKLPNSRVHIFSRPSMKLSETPKLGIFFEQSPRKRSRVGLSNTLDKDGIPMISLDWNLGGEDRKGLALTANYVAEALAEIGAGSKISTMGPEHVRPNLIQHSNHQLGTTRMSTSSKTGVVDLNSRVHEVSNLYVAGGSIFPTVSWANPSFTVVQCSLRLAAHLSNVINNRSDK